MSKMKNSGLDQYGAEPFKQQQFRTAGVSRGKKSVLSCLASCIMYNILQMMMMIILMKKTLFPATKQIDKTRSPIVKFNVTTLLHS